VTDNFYRAFEDIHRGSRELIKNRLRVYLPFIEPFLTFDEKPVSLDLGCGRGEWLELMSEAGFDARGVDLDEGMLEACHARGLNASHGDALAVLRAVPGESLTIVSAFHFVEHVSFELLEAVVSEALRALRPGGLLIFETPNPENIVVATNNFYLDPTHQKPIPSMLLSFVVEHAGFDTVKTLRLQEAPGLRNANHAVSLMDVLHGASPDYAVVAQKAAEPAIKEPFARPFAVEYGLSLEQLAVRHDAIHEARLQQMDATMARLNARFEATAAQLQASLEQLEDEMQQLEDERQQLEDERQRLQVEIQQLKSTLTAMLNSSSWELTAPFRKAGHILKNLFAYRGVKIKIKILLMHLFLYLNRRPALKGQVIRVLSCFPIFRHRLSQVLGCAFAGSEPRVNAQCLSPRARHIYELLKTEIYKRQGSS
jgi:O-antigen chain-terminating methyltransferase